MILHYIITDLKWDVKAWGIILISLLFSFFAIDQNQLASNELLIYVIFGVGFGYMSSIYSLQGNFAAAESKFFNLKYLISIVSSKNDFVLASVITSGIFSLLYLTANILLLRFLNVVLDSKVIEYISAVLITSMAIRVTIFGFVLKSAENISTRTNQSIWMSIISDLYKIVTIFINIMAFALVFVVFEMMKIPTPFSSFLTVLIYFIVKYKYVIRLWDDQSLAFIRPKRDLVYLGKLYLIPLAVFAVINIYGFLFVK
jgi:hypothetical protein